MIVCIPRKTFVVSVTGGNCELSCDFCARHYLQAMKKISDIPSDNLKYTSLLISGGFLRNGTLPLPETDLFNTLSSRFRINLHLGFFDRNLERMIRLKNQVSVVSFNFLPVRSAIAHISREFKEKDYLDSYQKYQEIGFRVVPHILLGLCPGDDELSLIRKLKPFAPDKTVLLVKIPLEKSAERIDFQRIRKFILTLKETIPQSEIIIGCMRPGGEWRKRNDPRLVELPVSTIVNPAPGLFPDHGVSEECCVL
ncbi:MAG: hypothetical protein PHW04_05835 [Candidatus Wallbacteria bacterium]|nr:hypothetical protein [Candidatus Wallbacteria bacterium]